MSGWLPPGCTDADIDRACPGYDNDIPEILTGEEAEEAFGHLTVRDPDEMRRQTAEAFRNINALFEAQGLMLSALIGEGK